MKADEIVLALRRMRPQFAKPGQEVVGGAAELIESLQAELADKTEMLNAAISGQETLQAELAKVSERLAHYNATGLTPGDIKDLQELCKENGIEKYLDLIVKAKRQMVISNERDIEQNERIEQLEAELAASQAREKAAVADLEMLSCCVTCKHKDVKQNIVGRCAGCDNDYSAWEWRGPQAGEGEAE